VKILKKTILTVILITLLPIALGVTPLVNPPLQDTNAKPSHDPSMFQSKLSSNTSAVCWVESFSNSETSNWIFTGIPPFLQNNTESYIMSIGTSNCSWFNFENVTLPSVQKVFLMIEWRTREIFSGGEAQLFIDNGVSEEAIGAFNLTLEYDWTEINITSAVKTIPQTNAAKLKIKPVYAGLYLVNVRRAYLRIYNGPVPIQKGTVAHAKVGSQVTLSVKWNDPDGLSTYALNHNASGSWLPQNITGSLTGAESWSNHTITLQQTTIPVLAYRFWANDTLDNWDKTNIYYVYPVKNFSPELLQHVEDVTGFPISHSYGRKDFYDNVTGRFWKFYSDGTNMKYTSTLDGQTWDAPQIIRPTQSGFMFYVHVTNGTVHYVYNSEGTGDDVNYRKGKLNSNGAITWIAPEQTAIDAGTTKKFYACSVITDQAGYPYIVFGNRTNPNLKTLNLIRSNNNDGTWLTTTGFPKQINENPDSDLVSGVALSLPSNEIYVIYCSAGNQEPPRGRIWQNPILSPLQNASNYTTESNYLFSAVTDSFGNIHLVYRRTSDRVEYSFRNSTTGNWEIKDELVTTHLTSEVLKSTAYSWPIIGWNPAAEEVYVHWWTLGDKSGWLQTRNSTGWKPRQRIIRLNDDFTLIDGDIIIPQSYQNQILLNFVAQNVTNARKEVWSYVYTNMPPVAEFTSSAETVYTREIIAFNASGSHDSDGIIVDYHWNFGDGTNATGPIVEHAYIDNGSYLVSLTVTDDDGATNSTSSTKTILNRSPIAIFTVSSETTYPSQSIVFNATQSYDPDGIITAYLWDFGDNVNASGSVVEHAYDAEGNYTVTLTVVDDDGAMDSATATQIVLRRDVAALAVTASKNLIGTGFLVILNVTVENQGDYTETLNITAYANATIIQTQTILLASGNYSYVTLLWNTTSFPKGNYTLSVTVDLVPGETDTVDNLLIDSWVLVTIPGDADGDRDVDIFDIVLVAIFYGLDELDPQFNPNCDLNCDGYIDIFDIVLAAGHYGESW